MDKLLIKILMYVFVAGIIPASTFAFFSEPDPYIHSMPFGVQKNQPGDINISPPPNFELEKDNNIKLEQNIVENFQQNQQQNQVLLENVLNQQTFKKLFLPIIAIFLFLSVVIFLIVKIIKSE